MTHSILLAKKIIVLYFLSVEGVAPPLRLDFSAFSRSIRVPPASYASHGVLRNSNTLEEFKSEDKVKFLAHNVEPVWRLIAANDADENASAIFDDTSRLNRFVVSTFADLKKYHYYYWFAFAAFSEPKDVREREQASTLDAVLSDEQLRGFVDAADRFAEENVDNAFFVLRVGSTDGDHKHPPLSAGRLTKDFASEVIASRGSGARFFLCFCDPSNFDSHPGWPLRNLLTLYAVRFAAALPDVDVICYRDRRKDGIRSVGKSLVLRLTVPKIDKDGEGWRMQMLDWLAT